MLNLDVPLTFPKRLTREQIKDMEERARLTFGLVRGYTELREQDRGAKTANYILIIRTTG